MDVIDLGIMGYSRALSVQEELLAERIDGEIPDTLIVCEHPPVLVMGRLSDEKNIRDVSYFKKNGIGIIRTSRGGELTCHSPGQLLLYPVIDLAEKKKDVSLYIDFLEKTIVGGLRELGVNAERADGERGVWTSGKKIGFIGIALRRWVTFHGACINLNNDLTPFTYIDPCGRSEIEVTSAREVVGRDINMAEARRVFARRFEKGLIGEYSTAQPVQ